MTFTYYINSIPINIHHRKKLKQKHTYLRIVDENTVQISSNYFYSKNNVLALLQQKEKWIYEKISKIKANTIDERYYLYLGKLYLKESTQFEPTLYYKHNCKNIIHPIIVKHTQTMQLFPNKITYRNNKSRWGSCSYKNNINLNIQLLKLPIELIEYVVVHELAHIKHKHHQKEFYEEIQKVLPNYKLLDKTLRKYTIR